MTYKVIFRDSNQEDILVEADDLFLRDDHYVFVYTRSLAESSRLPE